MRISNGPSAMKLNPLAPRPVAGCSLQSRPASHPPKPAANDCAIELKASPIKVTRGAWLPNSPQTPSNFSLASCQRFGVPVKADQMPFGSQQPCNPRGVPGQTQRAVHHRGPRAHPEKINRFLEKNRRMSFVRFRHAHPLGGLREYKLHIVFRK